MSRITTSCLQTMTTTMAPMSSVTKDGSEELNGTSGASETNGTNGLKHEEHEEQQYLALIRRILEIGNKKGDRLVAFLIY